MAYVPQEVILFGEDIRTNISYGKIDATDEEIRDAAKRAHALEFIEDFPDGFKTLVGERGIQLSGGQRRKVEIARTLAAKPKIESNVKFQSPNIKEIQRQINARKALRDKHNINNPALDDIADESESGDIAMDRNEQKSTNMDVEDITANLQVSGSTSRISFGASI